MTGYLAKEMTDTDYDDSDDRQTEDIYKQIIRYIDS